MTQENFHKTDAFNAPKEYDILEIHVTGFSHTDIIPTAVYVQILCKSKDGTLLHSVASTRNSYLDMRSTDAIIRDIREIARIFRYLRYPKDHIDLYIHDLAAYMVFTHQMHPVSSTANYATRRSRRKLMFLKVATHVHLGDGKLKQEFVQYIWNIYKVQQSILPTFELLGHNKTTHFNEQCEKRRKLNERRKEAVWAHTIPEEWSWT